VSKIDPVAIIGIGCRFPSADGPEAFWRLLAGGVDAIKEVPSDRWRLDELYDSDATAPGKMSTRWGGFLGDIDRFDATFFGIAPREAAHIDPQQRLLMEVAWEAMEDAGLPPDTLAGQKVGVFVGMSSCDYGHEQLACVEEIQDGYAITGSALSIGANRLSYVFDFRGPSLVIDTACSSSLVAVYEACQSVHRGESRIALAGGVNLILSPAVTVGFSKLQAMAPDGRCKAFDARANGFVRGEGAGIVVLKPLASALSDGDRIYAVIRGGAINQDGRTNGLTAPNGLSQEALLREALSNAGVRPSEIQFVEAHGTGTALGDPIELNALGGVLVAGRPREARCAVGSVKTNIGHLEAAAGVAGLIKLALCIQRRQLVPSLHFEKPNAYIRFDILPLRVVTRLEPVHDDSRPARCGISSFGFGGTNAHLILEEAPERSERRNARDDRACILPISARTETALRSLVGAYLEQLGRTEQNPSFEDLCASAARGRSHHDFRLAAVAASQSEMADRLSAFLKGETPADVETGRRVARRRRKVAFVFSGQGSQWLGMGRSLFEREPVFASAIAACDAAIRREAGWSVVAELHASPEVSRLEDVEVIQPAIFAIQVALDALWRSWGVRPDAVVGHSMGEVAAAQVAGALSLEDATRIICHRSRLVRRTSGRGAMAVVEVSFARSIEILAGYEQRLSVAVNNSPTSTVLSGEPEALEEVLASLERERVFCRRVKVDYASHSPQMDSLRDELLSGLAGLSPRKTKIPWYSTVTGAIAPGSDVGPEYWVRNLRQPVLFASVMQTLVADEFDVFLEISPHPILVPAVQQCLSFLERDGLALGSLKRDVDERRSLLATLSNLYAIGKSVEWKGLYGSGYQRVTLPSYPWQRERYWFDDERGRSATRQAVSVKGTKLLIGDHIQPAWSTATHVWRRDLGTDSCPFLTDHRVDGALLVPASVYLEMALEAAAEILGPDGSFTIENVRFEQAMVLSEREVREVQVVFTRLVPARFRWEVFASMHERSADGGGSFTRHASGQISLSVGGRQPDRQAVVLGDVRARCPLEISGSDHYQHMTSLGLDYGAVFQGLESIWAGSGEAVGRLRRMADARGYQMHPVVLDSALQVVGAAQFNTARSIWMLVSIDRFRLLVRCPPETPLWAHATWKADGSRVSGHVTLLTETGEAVADITGAGFQRVDQFTDVDSHALYSVSWEKGPKPGVVSDDGRRGCVLIFADSTGVAARVAEQVTRRMGRPVLVKSGTTCAIPDDLANTGACVIDPSRSDDYLALLEAVARKGPALDAVVYLWSLDVENGASEASVWACDSALSLARALMRGAAASPPFTGFVTRGAHYVREGDLLSPFCAPVGSLVQGLAQEYPALPCTGIDLSSIASDADVLALVDELYTTDREQREQYVALRDGERFVARLKASEGALVRRPLGSAREGEAPGPFSAALKEPGNLSSVGFLHVARHRPARDEVELEMLAAGLSLVEASGSGVLAGDGIAPLWIECCGRLAALGSDVTGWSVGDEVLALARGSLSSRVHTKASFIVRKPRRLDVEEAATVPLAFLTAHYALHHLARLQRGDRVLIYSAEQAVGLACTALAQEAGAAVFAAVATDEGRPRLERLGVHRAVVSGSSAFVDQVMDATRGQGVDIVVNSLAGDALAHGVDLLRPGGRFVELGRGDRLEGAQVPLRHFQHGRSLFLVDLDSMMAKRPDACGRLLRRAVLFYEAKNLDPLPRRVFPSSDLSDAFQHLAAGSNIDKVVVRLDRGDITVAPPTDVSACIREDGTYVVTDGLGANTLFLGQWLVKKGVKHLVLASSIDHSPEVQDGVAAMERAGAHVLVERLDVADPGSVDAAFQRWAQDLPPIQGIVHAAFVPNDRSLNQGASERVHSGIREAWNIHCSSLTCPLDFLLLLSFDASVLGQGRSDDAAVHQFFDALAHFRRTHSQPATSVSIGPMLAEPGGRHRVGVGIEPLSPQQVLDAIERALLTNVPQALIMSVDWCQWRGAAPVWGNSPFFSELEGAASGGHETQEVTKKGLLDVHPEERAPMLAGHLRQHVARVLRLPVSSVDLQQPLDTMGIDSLMGVELKSRVERELGIVIPLLQLIKGPSLSDLARMLVGSMSRETTAPP
jgi:phthiocerol/phenolphthiocerol synthesis type-I polyketide synthase C